jgi:L-aspartate oxidase
VFARSCAQRIFDAQATLPAAHSTASSPLDPDAPVDLNELARLRHAMRAAMSRDVSIVRNHAGLDRASAALDAIMAALLALDPALSHPESRRLWHALRLAQLTVKAAGQRHESRGLHFSTNWPEQSASAVPSALYLAD